MNSGLIGSFMAMSPRFFTLTSHEIKQTPPRFSVWITIFIHSKSTGLNHNLTMFHQFSQFFSRVSTLFSGRFQVISASELRRIKDAIGVSNARAQRRGGFFMGIFPQGRWGFPWYIMIFSTYVHLFFVGHVVCQNCLKTLYKCIQEWLVQYVFFWLFE